MLPVMLRDWLTELLRPSVERIIGETDEDRGLVGRDELLRALNHLEERMTTAEQTEAASNERFAALLGTVIAEIKSLRNGQENFAEQLAQAVADGDKARADALAADALADADRLDQYSNMLSELYPADVPVVEVPPPGEPAEPPADSGVEVPDVDMPTPDVPVVEPPAEPGPGDDTA
jgi:hypothetical protein